MYYLRRNQRLAEGSNPAAAFYGRFTVAVHRWQPRKGAASKVETEAGHARARAIVSSVSAAARF